MCFYEERIIAVQLHIESGCNETLVFNNIRLLGFLSSTTYYFHEAIPA